MQTGVNGDEVAVSTIAAYQFRPSRENENERQRRVIIMLSSDATTTKSIRQGGISLSRGSKRALNPFPVLSAVCHRLSIGREGGLIVGRGLLSLGRLKMSSILRFIEQPPVDRSGQSLPASRFQTVSEFRGSPPLPSPPLPPFPFSCSFSPFRFRRSLGSDSAKRIGLSADRTRSTLQLRFFAGSGEFPPPSQAALREGSPRGQR